MRYQLIFLFIAGVFLLSQAFPAYSLEAAMPESETKQEPRQEKQTRDDLVITASKSEINRREIGASVTVISERQMEERGRRMVIDALKDVPGVAVSQSGPYGTTDLFIRGSKSRNVLVLVDGVRVNDPSSPNGKFDFAHLTSENVERIEVVRGSQSVLYGASASGGVINIITKQGTGSPRMTVQGEAGSYRTFRESLAVSGGSSEANYSVSLGRVDSRGFSAAAKADGAAISPERDGYENTTASSRMGMKVLNSGWINFAMRYTDARTDLDNDSYDDDPNYRSYSRQFSGVIEFSQPIFQWWEHHLLVNYMGIDRKSINAVDTTHTGKLNAAYSGTHRQVEWRNIVRLGEFDEIRLGFDGEQDTASTLSSTEYGTTEFGPAKVWTRAFYAQNHLRLLDRIFATAGVRYTGHQTFGSHVNYQVSGSVIAPFTETRLRGEVATGFLAPTLSELYDTSYGANNPDLKPEESKTVDVGVEQPLFDRRIVIEVAFFRAFYKNMFGYDASFKSINKDRVKTSGVEISVTLRPISEFQIDANYTYLERAEDLSTGARLDRNPKHQGSVYANLLLFGRLNLNSGIRYVGMRNDYWYDSMYTKHSVTMNGYYLMSAGASVKIFDDFHCFARVENAINRTYEEPVGYRTPRRSFYGGIKAVF